MLLTLMGCVARKAGTESCQLLMGKWWLADFGILTILVCQDLEARDKRQSSGNLLNQQSQLLIYKCVFLIVLNVHLSLEELLINKARYGLWLFKKLLLWLTFMSGLTLADKAKQPNLVNKVGILSKGDIWWQGCYFSLRRRLA